MRPVFYIAERPAEEPPAFSLAVKPARLRQFRRPPPLPAHLAALRDKLRPAKPLGSFLSFDDARVDACLGGGLPLGQLHEIGASGLDAETAALPAGFIASLLGRIAPAKPVFWIAPVNDLHPPGLLPYGLDPNRLVLVRPTKDNDTLAAMEVALREGVAAAVVGEVGQLDRYCLAPVAACLPAPRLHRFCGAPLAAWAPNRGPGGQRCRYPLAPHPDAQCDGCQGTRSASLARGIDACPRR